MNQARNGSMMIRALLWAYFGLLIFEGSIRKWIFPQYADAFLVIRDPVLILIYLIAAREGLFPRQLALNFLYLLAFCTFMISLGFGQSPLLVMLFGMHTNFLHLPLIFLMAALVTERDLRWMGTALFMLAPLMAILMALQFISASDAWINRGASLGSGQIETALGHIRPAGFFSYNTGATQFWCLCGAFLLDGWTRRQYRQWILILGVASLILGISVSGSRTAVASLLIVLVSFIIISPRAGNIARTGWIIGAIALIVLAVASTGLFREGVETLSTRFEEANSAEGSMGNRFLGDFTISFDHTPFFGWGLGLGTNVGAKLMTGETSFLISEGEWGRVVGESGMILGIAFLLWRFCLALSLLQKSWAAAPTRGPLAWLIFSTTGLNVINGQWGQATSLGFTVFGAGLCLAAARPPWVEDETAGTSGILTTPTGNPRGRAIFAEALHTK